MIVKIATAVAAVGVLVGAVMVADSVPTHTPAPPHVEHRAVTPAEQPVACPGALEVPVGAIDSGDSDLDSGSSDVTSQQFTDGNTADVGGAFASDAPIAATIERVGGGDIAGLAALTCVRPSLSQWLVGGSTSLGASARLVLTNPADAPVEVAVSAFGPIGPIDEPMVIVVGPQSTESVLLEGRIPENSALALNIEANGTGVVAALQESRLDGFEPAGTDWIGRAADPATDVIIPAVGPSTPGDDGGATVVLLAPDGATVTLALATADGATDWPGAAQLELEPGVVTEIAVPELESGAVEVTADAPIVAAAVSRVARDSTTGRAGAVALDTMWVAGQALAASPLSLVAVTDNPALAVYSATRQEVSVTNAAGEVVASKDIPAHSVQRLSVEATAGDVLTIGPGFAWVQVVADADGFVTSVAPVDTQLRDLDVAVLVDSYVPAP